MFPKSPDKCRALFFFIIGGIVLIYIVVQWMTGHWWMELPEAVIAGLCSVLMIILGCMPTNGKRKKS